MTKEREKEIESIIETLKKTPSTYEEVRTEALLNGLTIEEHLNKMLDKQQDIIDDCELIFHHYICGNPSTRQKRIFFIINHEDDEIETAEEIYFYALLNKYKSSKIEKWSGPNQEQLLNDLIHATLNADNDKIYEIMDKINEAKKKTKEAKSDKTAEA